MAYSTVQMVSRNLTRQIDTTLRTLPQEDAADIYEILEERCNAAAVAIREKMDDEPIENDEEGDN